MSLEDLHTARMLRNHSLARHIADSCRDLQFSSQEDVGTTFRLRLPLG